MRKPRRLAMGLLGVALVFAVVAVGAGTLSDSNGSSGAGSHTHRQPRGKGEVFYLSPRGSDRNRGSARRPWRTLRKALSRARAGDTVVLRPGSYGRRGRITRIRRSGTPSNPLVIRGRFGGRRPRIVGAVRVDGDHVRLSRIVFDGPTGPVLERTDNNPRGEEVQIWLRGHGITLTRSIVRDNAWHAGVFVTGNENRITRNHIHDNGDRRDPRQRNLDHGIYWAGGVGGLVSDNLIERNLSYGVHLYPHPTRVHVVHNTLVHNGRAGLILAEDAKQALVANNIVAFNAVHRITSDLNDGANLLASNLFWSNGGGTVSGHEDLGDEPQVFADPLFEGPDDYRLRPGSPAIGRADPKYVTPRDFAGRHRSPTRTPDFGARELR